MKVQDTFKLYHTISFIDMLHNQHIGAVTNGRHLPDNIFIINGLYVCFGYGFHDIPKG